MPYTLNGIGTHYYGAGNRSARLDVCKSCGRSATLSSYDTREWICVIFIPLIPLRKYRILNDCSSCRRHHRIAANEFAQKLAEVTAPLRAQMRRAPDPEAHIALIQALIGWEMRADAEKELQAATTRFPQNVDIILLAAQLASGRGDLNAALPLYERAHGLDPQNAAATYGYGWILYKLERHDQAVPILQRAVSQEGNKLGALYLLGTSQMKLSRWNDALNAYQQLVALEPAYMQDKSLLRLMRECKQHLGYELNEAERRAGRSWWPFGRKAKPQTLQAQPTLVRPSLRIAGLVIAVIAIFSLGFYGWDRWMNIDVYFDNGLDRAVKLDLDSAHFDIAPNTFHKEALKQGAHTVVVRASDGKEIERLTFNLERLSIFGAMMHDRFFVYNVAAHNVYRRAIHGYAARAEDSSYDEELIGMQRFFEQGDVDFPFTPAPETISVDSNRRSAVKKVSFNAAKNIDLTKYALIRLRQGKMDEARTAIDRAVANAPCDTNTRRTQVYLAGIAGSLDNASEAAHHWIADCAQNDLEAHRTYQDVNTENGRQEALREEYRKMLSASPDSGKAHYLYGRVASDPALATAQYQEAIRLDPKLIWPRVALGHAYQTMERYDDALREFGAAVDMEGRDPSVVVYFATAAIAKGDPSAAVEKVDEIRKAHPRDYGALEARWLLALAAADWQRAAETQKVFAPLEGPQNAWWRNAKLLRIKGDPLIDARIDEAMRSDRLHPFAVQARIERLIETGDFQHAAETLAKNAKDIDPTTAAMLEAYTAAGFLLKGDRSTAEKLLTDAEKTSAAAPKTGGQRITNAVVAGLRGTKTVDEVLAVGRESDVMSHGWFVAGVRAELAKDHARAAQCFARCARAASDLDFPYLEAKAMAAKVGGSLASTQSIH